MYSDSREFNFHDKIHQKDMISQNLRVRVRSSRNGSPEILALYTVKHYSRKRCRVQEEKEINYLYKLLILNFEVNDKTGFGTLNLVQDLSERVNDLLFKNGEILEVDYLSQSKIVLLTADQALVLSLRTEEASSGVDKVIQLNGISWPINCIKPYKDSYYLSCDRNRKGENFWKNYGDCYKISKRQILEAMEISTKHDDKSLKLDSETKEDIDIGLLSMETIRSEEDSLGWR